MYQTHLEYFVSYVAAALKWISVISTPSSPFQIVACRLTATYRRWRAEKRHYSSLAPGSDAGNQNMCCEFVICYGNPLITASLTQTPQIGAAAIASIFSSDPRKWDIHHFQIAYELLRKTSLLPHSYTVSALTHTLIHIAKSVSQTIYIYFGHFLDTDCPVFFLHLFHIYRTKFFLSLF